MSNTATGQAHRYVTALFLVVAALLVGCAGQAPSPASSGAAKPAAAVPTADSSDAAATASPQDLASADEVVTRFEDIRPPQYTLGPGDRIAVTVWARPELSGTHVVGPDGDIQIPFLGSIHVASLTPDQASERLTSALSEYYVRTYASVTMVSYSGNSVTVLGHVAHPGRLTFNDNPTLLEVLAKAGTAQVSNEDTDVTRCAIFRGRNRALWLNLAPLYRGVDPALNIRMQRGDLVYVPDPGDQLVYVMGQVAKPGAYPLTPNMSFLDALADAGGPTDTAQPSKIVFARPSQNLQQVVDLDNFTAGDGRANYVLQQGDIIYVPKNGLAKVGWVMQQINPITSSLFVGAALF